MEFRKMSVWAMVILVWVEMVACGSNSSTINSAISDTPSEKAIKAGLEPTLISTTSVKTDTVATDWCESILTEADTHWRVFYNDSKSETPMIVQPSGQTNYDHWMTSVHDQFIVWQGSDAGLDVEIFYYDVSANSPAPVQVTTDAEWKGNLSLDHGKLVWNVCGEIYGADIYHSDPTQIRITDNQINDRNPKTKGELTIWEGNELAYAVRW